MMESKEIEEIAAKIPIVSKLKGDPYYNKQFHRMKLLSYSYPFDPQKAESARAEIYEEEPPVVLGPQPFTFETIVVRSDFDAKQPQ